jgi:hypothetical protein
VTPSQGPRRACSGARGPRQLEAQAPAEPATGPINAKEEHSGGGRRAGGAIGPDKPQMSSLKKTLMQQGMKLMTDPRVMKLMQDERVMKAMMAAMSVPGKAQSFARDQLETVAKAMALATEGEMKDLRRTVRKLEDEVAKLRAEGQPTSTSKKKSGSSAA